MVIDNSAVVIRVTHCACAGGMVGRVEAPTDDVFNLGIGLDLETGESLVTKFERLQRLGLPESAHTLESCDCGPPRPHDQSASSD